MKSAAELAQLAGWLAQTDIGLLELRGPEGAVRLDNPRSSGQGLGAMPRTAVAAPSVGVFLHGHPLDGAALVRAGERVSQGQPLGLLRIGPLLLPVAAPRDGVVAAVVVADGAAVGWGATLVELHAP
jgi:acetyl-CoA carboxylase biotin carboxyl carrier protein